MRLKKLVGILVLGAVAFPSLADDQALVIANHNYQFAQNSAGVEETFQITESLQRAGYRVTTAKNLDLLSLSDAINSFNNSAGPEDRLIYVYTGHLVHQEQNSFLAPVDLNAPSADTIAKTAIPLDLILNKAAQHAGASGVFLGWAKSARSALGGGGKFAFDRARGLSPRNAQGDYPQGVMVVDGPAPAMLSALKTQFLDTELSTREAANATRDRVRTQGYTSYYSYLTAALPDDVSITDVDPIIVVDPEIERAFWDFTQSENSIGAYEEFLTRYPNGKYSKTARATLAQLKADALISPEERVERAMNLTRAQRRGIQQDLTDLGFNTRGVDGIFGKGTRRAITQWQKWDRRLETGFLDPRQHAQLSSQAEAKRQEVAAAAKREREEREANDIAFWQATGASGSEYDLQVYLSKYPKGLYASQARNALKKFENEQAQREAEIAEQDLWRQVSERNTVKAYQLYLQRYPNGRYAAKAKQRISGSSRKVQGVIDAKRAEESMRLNKGAWLIIESRLKGRGYKISRVDGVVDESTRVAIRKFQQASKLPATGFVDQTTFSQVMFR